MRAAAIATVLLFLAAAAALLVSAAVVAVATRRPRTAVLGVATADCGSDPVDLYDDTSDDCNDNDVPDSCDRAILITSPPQAQAVCPGSAGFSVVRLLPAHLRAKRDCKYTFRFF